VTADLTLHLGDRGSGRTTRLARDAVRWSADNPGRKGLILVPTFRDAQRVERLLWEYRYWASNSPIIVLPELSSKIGLLRLAALWIDDLDRFEWGIDDSPVLHALSRLEHDGTFQYATIQRPPPPAYPAVSAFSAPRRPAGYGDPRKDLLDAMEYAYMRSYVRRHQETP
jgi:hypothetical protein